MRSKTARLALAALVLALGAGCDSSTAPIQDPLVFEGVIASRDRISHEFTLENGGTIRIQFNRIEEQPVEGFEPLDVIWQLGLGIGRPNAGECATTYSVSARVGQLQVLGLNEGDYCVLVFDTGFLPEVRILEYTVTISPGT